MLDLIINIKYSKGRYKNKKEPPTSHSLSSFSQITTPMYLSTGRWVIHTEVIKPLRYTIMIRVFDQFCKYNIRNISSAEIFGHAMDKICLKDYPCPLCSSKYPQWKRHGAYKRYLISFKNNQAITDQITITRYRCLSCNGTHAILPESIIPYQSYSLIFILRVLKDYFTRQISVESICIKYEISVSTLYSWKKLFLKEKKVWLGLLVDFCTQPLDFIDSFFSQAKDHSYLYKLKEFFLIANVSFMQQILKFVKKAYYIPL